MARHDIRGTKLPDGSYALTAKDVYNVNDNFMQISQEVFGTSNFTRKVEKRIEKVEDDVDTISQSVSGIEDQISELNQTATNIDFVFSNAGSKNLIYNSGFIDDGENWIVVQGSASNGVRFSDQYPDMPSGCATLLKLETGVTNQISQIISKGFASSQRKYTVSGHIRNTSLGLGATNPYAGIELEVTHSDDTKSYFAVVPHLEINYAWKKFTKTIELDKDCKQMRLTLIARDMQPGTLYVSSLVLEEGKMAHQWSNNNNEIFSTTHRFTKDGYSILDINGAEIMSRSKGVANEQNIGRVDNVESGFPMKIPFHIGSEVSQITQAVLKWDISKFRTYSKGAASGGGTKTTPSGGGSTSGPSSKSTADNDGPVAFVSNTQTELSYPNEGNHYHRITAEQMTHSHGMAHTHTTPSHTHSIDITHEHAPVYGILEPNIVDYVFTVYVDGVLRATLNAQRGEVDLSAWITTSGWHEIMLQVNNLMRIDANLFLKTYIRR